MDDIPMPSSPDSPGPPGEEHVKKEEIIKTWVKRESPRSFVKDASHGETYSPSMVTSSPEYTPGEENDVTSSDSHSKSGNQVYKDTRKLSESPSAHTALDMKKKVIEASVLKSQRLEKQRLKTCVAGKGGTISFGISKTTKLNKTGNASPFVAPDDEYSDHKAYPRSNASNDEYTGHNKWIKGRSEEAHEKSSPHKDKEGNNRKLVGHRGKESSKMNIDSIIEEESRQRALKLPKVQLIEIPKHKTRPYVPGVLSAVRDTESKLDWKHLTDTPNHSGASELGGTETTVDQMGFVINQRAVSKQSNALLTSTDEKRSSDGYRNRKERYHNRSRSRSRSRDHEGKVHRKHSKKSIDYKTYRSPPRSPISMGFKMPIPENVMRVPSSWKECRENNIEVCQIKRIKDLYENKEESSGRNDMDSLMISIERACVTEQETHDSNQLSIMGANDYSFECETAVKNLLGNEWSSGISNTEYEKKEFPKRCIKKTKAEPIIQWGYNPRHDASAYLMSRKDILDEASAEEMQYLKFIMNCNQTNNTDNIKSFEKPRQSSSWYATESSFLNSLVTESQKASHKDNRYSNKDSKVYPRGNEVPNTQREDSRTEDNNIPGWFKNVAENFKFPSSVGSAMNSDNKESLEKGSPTNRKVEAEAGCSRDKKDKKKKRKREKDDEDLLSSLLFSKKKKKKETQHIEDNDKSMTRKKSKKKRKDKKKKSRKHIGVLEDPELPWEDPQKLVQLNQVVSMGCHLPRSDKVKRRQSRNIDSDESVNEDYETCKTEYSTDIQKCEDVSKENTQKYRFKNSPSPPCHKKDTKKLDTSIEPTKISNEEVSRLETSGSPFNNRPTINEQTILKEEKGVRSGPRTPPTPKSPTYVRQRTGPRTPSPQPSKTSFEKCTDNGARREQFSDHPRPIRRSSKEFVKEATYSDHGNASWRPSSPSHCPKSYNEKNVHHSPTNHEPKSTELWGYKRRIDSPMHAHGPPVKGNDGPNVPDSDFVYESSKPTSLNERPNHNSGDYPRRKDCSKSPISSSCRGQKTAQSENGPNRPNQQFTVKESKLSNDPKSSRSPELPRQKLYNTEVDKKTYSKRSPREHSRSPSHRDYRAGRCPSAGRRTPPHEFRRGRYRRTSPSPPYRYSRRSPERRRSPNYSRPWSRDRRPSVSPPRRGYSSPYHKGRQPPSPQYYRRGYESPPRDRTSVDRSRLHSTYSNINQLPDSTINDAELITSGYSHRRPRNNDPGSSADASTRELEYYARGSISSDIPGNIGNHYISNLSHPLLDKESSRHFSVAHPGANEHLLSIDGSGHMNSPKRLSLDERLEKELGIKVREEHRNHDYSRPPPGYLASGERSGYPAALQSNSVSSDSQVDHSSTNLIKQSDSHPGTHFSLGMHNYNEPLARVDIQTNVTATPNSSTTMPTQLGIVPQYPERHVNEICSDFSNIVSDVQGVNISLVDPPEEGRLVRVGNMLQIVPESEQPQNRMLEPSTRKSALEDSHHFTTQVPSQNAEEARTKELLQKVEEMGRRKDAERRKRREQRMAERMQQALPQQDTDSFGDQQDAENDTGSYVHDDFYGNTHDKNDATIEEKSMEASPNSEISRDPPTNFNENKGKPRSSSSNRSIWDVSQEGKSIVLPDPQALSTNSMSELNSIMLAASQKPSEQDALDETTNSKNKKRLKNKSEVRYISLKPLDKREKKRQEKIQEMRRMVKNEASNMVTSCSNEGAVENDDSFSNFETEEFIPRSPVPLPDVSTCKPILVQLGFSLSNKEKKVLRYADGVLPGQGSPDHTEECSGTGTSTHSSAGTTAASGALSVKRSKKRKRIRLTIIEQISPSDDDDCEIPPPPPGSPPLFTIKEFIARYSNPKPVIPLHVVSVAN